MTAIDKYNFSPEIWFTQSAQHYPSDNYIHAYLVCGNRWLNKPLVMGRRFNVHIRDSFEILSDYYLKNHPYQSIVHPITVRLSFRELDNIQDPEYRKTYYPQIPNTSCNFLPKELPEITCYNSFASHSLVAKDCQEYGYSAEVATAVLYWAYKIAGFLDKTNDNSNGEINKTLLSENLSFELRMKEILECYPDMWKVAAFANWPKWENQMIKLDKRVEILKNIGFDLDVSDLKRECSFFGINRSVNLE